MSFDSIHARLKTLALEQLRDLAVTFISSPFRSLSRDDLIIADFKQYDLVEQLAHAFHENRH